MLEKSNIPLVWCLLISSVIVGCNSGGTNYTTPTPQPTTPVSKTMAFILNQGANDISVCPILDSGSNLGPCSSMNPTTTSKEELGSDPLYNVGGSPIGIAIKGNYAFISVDNSGSPLVDSNIISCKIEATGQFDHCYAYPTTLLAANAYRAFQVTIVGDYLYFPTRPSSNTPGSVASIVACKIGEEGSLSSDNCTLYQSIYPARDTDYSLVGANHKLYGISTANKFVNIISLSDSGAPDGPVVTDHALNSQGDPTLISPRMMTIANGYAYITDPSQPNNQNLIACQITAAGGLANCQPQTAQTSAGQNIFTGPVGVGSYQQTVFPLNWGYNASHLGNSLGVCDESLGNASTTICKLSWGDDVVGISTLYIPISMAVAELK